MGEDRESITAVIQGCTITKRAYNARPAPPWVARRRRNAASSREDQGMPDDEDYESSADLEDDGVLDASDTLEGDPGDDPLDTGIAPPDRWSAGEGFGTTEAEEQAGESLDQLLAQEEPDVDPY